MEHFKVGDVVELKSGGPLMTVNSIDGAYADCVWFNGVEGPHFKSFAMLTLTAARRS